MSNVNSHPELSKQQRVNLVSATAEISLREWKWPEMAGKATSTELKLLEEN